LLSTHWVGSLIGKVDSGKKSMDIARSITRGYRLIDIQSWTPVAYNGSLEGYPRARHPNPDARTTTFTRRL
jgi:hypothetical protein